MLKFIFCLLPILSFSQSFILQGNVHDADTGEPISNVDVYFKTNSYGTISNSKGYFIIDRDAISELDTLVFSHLGYQEHTIKVIDFINLAEKSITLHPTSIELEEVVLKPLKVKEILTEAIANFDTNHLIEKVILSGTIKQVSEENNKITRIAYSNIFLKIPKSKIKTSRKVEIIPSNYQLKIEENSLLENYDLIKLNQLFGYLNIKEKLFYFSSKLESFDKVSVKNNAYGSFNVNEVLLEKNITETKKARITIILEQETKAILSFIVEGDRGEGIENWHTLTDEKFKKVSRIPTYSSAKINFRPFNNKWVLKEIYANLYVDCSIISNGEKKDLENFNYVKIDINDFDYKTRVSSNSFDLKKDIFNQIESTKLSDKDLLKENMDVKELEFINEIINE